MATQPIPDWIRERYRMMESACRFDRLALLSCIRRSDGLPAFVICAVNHNADQSVDFVPLGEMCTADNPYEAYDTAIMELERGKSEA